MKTLLLSLLLLLGLSSSAAAQSGPYHHDGYNPSPSGHDRYRHHERRFVKVVKSRPLYEEVVVYEACAPRRSGGLSRQGAVIGAVVGALVGERMGERHKVPHIIGGAVTGGVIGSAIGRRGEPGQRYCKKTERRLVGYKNIAYWHGKKIVEVSRRPLKRIAVGDRYATYRR